MLEFVCKVYGGLDVCTPEEWSAQYADAQMELNEVEGMELSEEQTTNTQAGLDTQHQTQRTRTQRWSNEINHRFYSHSGSTWFN